MGKIFGISNNPVSTIESAIKTMRIEPPKASELKPVLKDSSDKFVSVERQKSSNAFVKMRNGIGRLMSHFSHPKNS